MLPQVTCPIKFVHNSRPSSLNLFASLQDRFDTRLPDSLQGRPLPKVLFIALGGPLLVMTGFTVVATVTLILVSSPLLTISSPLLISAGLVLVAALAGFAGAGAMALTGLLALGWVFRSVDWAGMFRGIDDDASVLVLRLAPV
ncbi:hypothetical protein RHGRI_009375 [Rhododendron griersonianum]|uniref:Oleosin n=1 Tax=Rhododendron griersonianum TaxID=479676 RepID=A0AAV6KEJ2_9ERIC|nr:hypothetical protein RHGRI_009375 [Rhododendron griersonianum]